jgi:hypothetical protein
MMNLLTDAAVENSTSDGSFEETGTAVTAVGSIVLPKRLKNEKNAHLVICLLIRVFGIKCI